MNASYTESAWRETPSPSHLCAPLSLTDLDRLLLSPRETLEKSANWISGLVSPPPESI